VGQRCRRLLAGITVTRDMVTPIRLVTGEFHMLAATRLRAARTTLTRRGVHFGKSIATHSRSLSGQAVVRASERFWAAGEVRALARWLVLAVQRYTPTSFGTDIVVTRLNVDGDEVSTVTL